MTFQAFQATKRHVPCLAEAFQDAGDCFFGPGPTYPGLIYGDDPNLPSWWIEDGSKPGLYSTTIGRNQWQDVADLGMLERILWKAFAADDYPVIYGEDFTCACGNDSGKSGFSPCTPEGVEMEPAEGWEGHYLCNKCKLVLVQDNDEEPGLCTIHGVQCEADGSGAVICPVCIQTPEGRERL